MRKRIISAAAGLLLFMVVMIFKDILLDKVIFIIALIGINEFYDALIKAGYRPFKVIGYLSCLPILFVTHITGIYIALLCFAVLVILMAMVVFEGRKYKVKDAALTVFGILYVAFLFSFVVLTQKLENGNVYIWLVFAGAWITDTFAFFTGKAFGKRKILPEISPKKTVAGFIGGFAGCIFTFTIAGVVIHNYINLIPVFHYTIMGTICGFLSQMGDWAASAIKRYADIKDYSSIMPGHGGVLDRFDSVLFTAPVIYFYISLVV
jgi:phosphatidate cytidylyltransferase